MVTFLIISLLISSCFPTWKQAEARVSGLNLIGFNWDFEEAEIVWYHDTTKTLAKETGNWVDTTLSRGWGKWARSDEVVYGGKYAAMAMATGLHSTTLLKYVGNFSGKVVLGLWINIHKLQGPIGICFIEDTAIKEDFSRLETPAIGVYIQFEELVSAYKQWYFIQKEVTIPPSSNGWWLEISSHALIWAVEPYIHYPFYGTQDQFYIDNIELSLAGPAAIPIDISSVKLLYAVQGFETNRPILGNPLLISIVLKNTATSQQSFTCITQVKDEKGVVEFRDLIDLTLQPGEMREVNIGPWNPAKTGTYTLEVFCWKSIDIPIPVSTVQSISFQTLKPPLTASILPLINLRTGEETDIAIRDEEFFLHPVITNHLMEDFKAVCNVTVTYLKNGVRSPAEYIYTYVSEITVLGGGTTDIDITWVAPPKVGKYIIDVYCQKALDDPTPVSNLAKATILVTGGSAVILDPFYWQHPNNELISKIMSYLEAAGYYDINYFRDSEVTVELLRSVLDEAPLIFWRTHGSPICISSGEEIPEEFIVNGKVNSEALPPNLKEDFEMGRIIKFDIKVKGGEAKSYWAIGDSFIRYYYIPPAEWNKHNQIILFVEACETLKREDLARSFDEAGFGVYIGYGEPIGEPIIPFLWKGPDLQVQQAFYNLLLKGYTVEETVDDLNKWYRFYRYPIDFYPEEDGILRAAVPTVIVKSFGVSVSSPVAILVVDPEGRRTGFDFVKNQVINEIPEAIYYGRGIEGWSEEISQVIWIPVPSKGEYKVKLTGIKSGSYELRVGLEDQTQTYKGEVKKGQILTSKVKITEEPTGELTSTITPPSVPKPRIIIRVLTPEQKAAINYAKEICETIDKTGILNMTEIKNAFEKLLDAKLINKPKFAFEPEKAEKYLARLEEIYGKYLKKYPTAEGRIWLLYMLNPKG